MTRESPCIHGAWINDRCFECDPNTGVENRIVDHGREQVHPTQKMIGDIGISRGGITKRQHYASLAMSGMIAHGWTVPRLVAKGAVEFADALIKELDWKPVDEGTEPNKD